MPIIQFGPLVLSSGSTLQSGQGWPPQTIDGPSKQGYVVEHQVPGAEGGIVEYMGSAQRTITLRGFLAPREIITDGAATFLSGSSYYVVAVDTAKELLAGLRGSGAHALKIESTYSNYSGYAIFYENDVFYITDLTFGYEPGHAYPFYPYTINLKRTANKSYGNSSGVATYAPTGTYFSGYTRIWRLRSGAWPVGETINTIALYAQSVASGNAKVAVYRDFGGAGSLAPLAQSASQPITSGWNYFPLNPSFVTISGNQHEIAIKSDADSSLGWQLQTTESTMAGGDPNPQCSGAESFVSGTTYSTVFPDPYVTDAFTHVSGNCFKSVIIVA